MRWALIRGWVLINFSAFRMGANSRLGAYSNKYGIFNINGSKKKVIDSLSFLGIK